MLEDELVEEPRLAEVVLDRLPERLGPVGAEREPELQGAERAGVLERDVDHVARAALVRDVRLVVREGIEEVLAAADEKNAAGLRKVEPLVRVERDRVDAVEPGEQVRRRGSRRRRQPVGAVDVQPDALLRADVRQGGDRVDGAR